MKSSEIKERGAGEKRERGTQTIDISAKRRFKRKNEPLKIDNRSFLALLIRSFVSFTGIIVISMVLIILFAYWVTYSGNVRVEARSIADYSSELEQGRFSSVPISRFLGKKGWLEIVNMDGAVVFSTRGTENEKYTLGELDCITRYGSGESVTAHRFVGEGSAYSYIVTKSFSNGAPDQYQLVDEDLTILSGTIATTKLKYTEKEFELLLFNDDHDDMRMERYSFTSGGENFYAVYLDAGKEETESR